MGSKMRAQGATQLSLLRSSTYCPGNRPETIARAEPRFCCAPERCDVLVAPLFAQQKEGLAGQGATEYLVLLAVVLIVALVSVALLGFFPGMASDAQITQSQMYWQSASPIAITESSARFNIGNTYTYPYMKLRNNGAYPIRITGIYGDDGYKSAQFNADNQAGCSPSTAGTYNMSDSGYFYIPPGGEMHISTPTVHGTTFCRRQFFFFTGSGSNLVKATALCQNSSVSPGAVVVSSFGFEYIEYLDSNQQITKRQVGAKPLIIKCREPY